MEIKIRYNQYWGSGSEIRDPVFFDAGSGMEKNPDLGSGIQDKHLG
jgi:hypothetical protein